MVIIRKQHQKDKEQIETISQKNITLLRKFYYPNRKAIKGKKEISKKFTNLVAELDKNIVGYCKYYIQENKLCICDIGVNQKIQNKGIGREMLKYLNQTAKDRNLSKLSLYTVKRTGNTQKFEKWGFQTISEEVSYILESYNEDRIIEVYMEKELS